MPHLRNIDETQIVELVQRRDSAAMRELYDRHIRYLTAVGGRYVDDDTLRDVLQESFESEALRMLRKKNGKNIFQSL